MTNDQSSVTLAPLARADGSAKFSSNGYTIISAVNGPIEVQRRDELPQEAAIDIVIRPATGVGCVRERHLEAIVQSTLRHIIVVSAHPRTLIQVTLQVIQGQDSGSASSGIPQSASNLPLLPALLQTAMLALLTTSIPLAKTLNSALIAVDQDGTLLSEPSSTQMKDASSVHVFAFSSLGELLVVESEGDFTFNTWQSAHDQAAQICRGSQNDIGKSQDGDRDEGMDMEAETTKACSKEELLRAMVQEQVLRDQKWQQIPD